MCKWSLFTLYFFFMSLSSNFNTFSELQIGNRNRKILDILIYKNNCIIINKLKY